MGQPSAFVERLRSRLLGQGAAGDEALLGDYLTRRDGAAFEALVRRHGPMVLGVCRRILGNADDADDAFQATFLVLVRKADAVRPRSMVGNWLYGVACRTARDARRAAARRRAKEAAMPPRTPPSDDLTDLRAVLDEELERLPPKYRAVVILSDLEEKTRQEVARQLGWPEGTVASRLSRARARLARRLARRGLAVPGASAGTLLAGGAGSAAMPPPLAGSTVRAAGLLAAGRAAAVVAPARIITLTEGALKAMLLDKLLKTTALLFVVGVLGAGTGLALSYAGGADGPGPKTPPTVPSAAGPKGGAGAVATAREAPGKGDPAKELQRLKGVWVCVGYERDGEEHLGQPAVEAMWNETLWFHTPTTARGDWLNLSWERKGVGQTSAAAVFTLPPAATPKAIDLVWKSVPAPDFMPAGVDPAWEQATRDARKLDRAQPGVYAVEGDRLRLCWGALGGDRPAGTKTKRGDPWTVHLYEKKRE